MLIIVFTCSRFVDDDKENDDVEESRENCNETPLNFEANSNITSGDQHSPPILTSRRKPLKREKSRVQFFLENDASANRATSELHRLEDSPSASWKSEYSGTDLRKLTHCFVM